MSPQNWIKQGDVSRVMVPTAIFPEMSAGVPAARVYAALAMRANNITGLVDSTIKQIADDAKMSTSQVSDGLSRLIADGWVTRVRSGHSRQSSKYQMHAFPHAELPGFPASSTPFGVSGNPGGLDETAGQGLAGNPGGSEETAGQEAPGNPGSPNGVSGNPDWTTRKSGHPLVSPKTCLTKELTTTTSSAPLPSEDDQPGDNLFGETLAVVHELKPARTKTAVKPSGYTDDFQAFWSLYPRREAKKPAFDSWQRAMKKTTPEVVMAAVTRYAASRQGQDPKYTAQATTWLNQERWEDEPVVAHKQASGGYQAWTNPTNQDDYDQELLP